MLSNLRYLGYSIILFLFLHSSALSQIDCDDCGGVGTLEGPFTTYIYVDTTVGSGCQVKIEYYKRTCKGFTNVFVTNYQMSGSNCSSLSDYTKIDRALSGMLHEGTAPLPPYDSNDVPAYWRIRRPTCWQKNPILVDSVATDNYTSCPSAECCETYFKATATGCGRIITYIPMKDTSNCPTPIPPMQCIHSCGRDPLDAWK